MAHRTSLPLDPDARELGRRWLENWRHVGPILEAERWERLASMTERQRADTALDLLGLWQPDRPGDEGEALVRVQQAFVRWRRHAA